MYKIFVVLAVVGVTLAAPSKSFVALGHFNTTLFNKVGIVGGQSAEIKDHPFQISLQYRSQHFCGGFLISPTWVVTAAHCITQGYRTNLSIRAGSARTTAGGQTSVVNQYIVHPQYSDDTIDNDIALLRLATPITNVDAKAATLPPAGSDVKVGSTLSVTGWGYTSENGRGPATLQQVTVPTVDRAYCKTANAALTPVTKNMFCAGYKAGGKDSCQGDSGGPAAIDGVVVGIISWGNGCARANFPGVYTNLANYRGWITLYAGV